MSIGLVVLARNEEKTLPRLLESASGLVDKATVYDTGSVDGTREAARALGAKVMRLRWESGAQALTEAHRRSKGTDWLLWAHADMTVEAHPDLRDWLASEPHPDLDGFMVETEDHGTSYRLPALLRSDRPWEWHGATHEWLDTADRYLRPLLGLTLHHHADGANRPGKFERDLELLTPGYEAGDARDTFYFAQTLKDLGRFEEAAAVYRKRARMGGWEEEAWYAYYMAARLSGDVDRLIDAHRRRPWRPEPLHAAAEIVAQDERRTGDTLFLEQRNVR